MSFSPVSASRAQAMGSNNSYAWVVVFPVLFLLGMFVFVLLQSKRKRSTLCDADERNFSTPTGDAIAKTSNSLVKCNDASSSHYVNVLPTITEKQVNYYCSMDGKKENMYCVVR